MSESNGKLSGLKGKPSPFTLEDGTEVLLRPITYEERTELFNWFDDNKDTPRKNLLLQQRIVALVLDESVESIGQCDPEKIDEIAREAGARNGITKREGEKKVTPPDSSETPTSNSPANSPLPVG